MCDMAIARHFKHIETTIIVKISNIFIPKTKIKQCKNSKQLLVFYSSDLNFQENEKETLNGNQAVSEELRFTKKLIKTQKKNQ